MQIAHRVTLKFRRRKINFVFDLSYHFRVISWFCIRRVKCREVGEVVEVSGWREGFSGVRAVKFVVEGCKVGERSYHHLPGAEIEPVGREILSVSERVESRREACWIDYIVIVESVTTSRALEHEVIIVVFVVLLISTIL